MGSRSGWNSSLVIRDLIAVYNAVIVKIGFFLSTYCFFSLFDHRPSFERFAAHDSLYAFSFFVISFFAFSLPPPRTKIYCCS